MKPNAVRFLLLLAAASASAAWAKPKILDRTVVGCWKFNGGQYAADSSGYGSTLTTIPADVGKYTSGSFDGSGYVSGGTSRQMTGALGAGAPTLGTYTTFAMRFKTDPSCEFSESGLSGSELNFAKIINDHNHWNFIATRYQKDAGTGSSYAWMMVCNPTNSAFWSNSTRPETAANRVKFPVAVSGNAVTIGGQIGLYIESYWKSDWLEADYLGDIDEAIVINRFLTKTELTRLYQTGETYVFPTAQPSFVSSTGWSHIETANHKKGPLDLPVAAFIVDNNYEMFCADDVSIFGGSIDNEVSLTFGRKSVLKNLYGDTVVENLKGNLRQQSGKVLFYDLRLVQGRIYPTLDGLALETTLLDVETNEANAPYEIFVDSGRAYAFNAGGHVTGSGVLAKLGAGKLTLNGFTAAAGEHPKFRMTAGTVKTSVLNGYTGGTVLLDTASAVNIAGGDTITGKITVKFDGTAPTSGKYDVLTVPTSVMTLTDATVGDYFEDTTAYAGGKCGKKTVRTENGIQTVSIEVCYEDDTGTVPVLIGEGSAK